MFVPAIASARNPASIRPIPNLLCPPQRWWTYSISVYPRTPVASKQAECKTNMPTCNALDARNYCSRGTQGGANCAPDRARLASLNAYVLSAKALLDGSIRPCEVDCRRSRGQTSDAEVAPWLLGRRSRIAEVGRRQWRKASGANQQARAENGMYRYKRITGGGVSAPRSSRRKRETRN